MSIVYVFLRSLNLHNGILLICLFQRDIEINLLLLRTRSWRKRHDRSYKLCYISWVECDYFERDCDYFVTISPNSKDSDTNGFKGCSESQKWMLWINADYTTWFCDNSKALVSLLKSIMCVIHFEMVWLDCDNYLVKKWQLLTF